MLLGLAKELMPRTMAESLGQVQSYLASCHFSLRQYPEALEAGKEAYKIRPGRSLVCKINVYFYLMLFFSVLEICILVEWSLYVQMYPKIIKKRYYAD